MITLDKTKNNMKYVLSNINISQAQNKHMEDMGLINGAKLEIFSNNNGNVICKILGTRLAITKDISKNIYVNERNVNNL